ncbi:MAG TPA: trimeric intracellular cation channel family protein [Verrucomicrobiales bacterium]|nr:trimeric intracellular cation channel family protein [Verrucomicrobiales bacterium]
MTAADLQPYLDHASVAVGAITGVLAAKGKQIDLFGVLVLALATAFGGGTVRDLLVGDTPVVWLRGPALMLNAIGTAMVTFFAARWIRMPRGLLQLADAVALAFWVMLGVGKGLAFNLSPPVAVLLGVITGCAGGIVRDVLLDEVPFVFRREIHLYATAAIAGGIVAVLLQPAGVPIAASAGFLTVLGLRLAAMKWKLSLPVFEMKE